MHGDVLQGRYRLDAMLGRGGMGGVYRAHHLNLDVDVAVKEMTLQFSDPLEQEAAIRQFQQEAQMLHHLHHPGLPRVHDFFVEANGRAYLVMDLIQGRSLEQVCSGPTPEATVLQWAAQIGDVLQFLHSQDAPIIFRDLKPSNIMLTDAGQIKLIDFGIAKTFDRQTGLGTQTASRGAGSPGFAAPEQYGAGTDARTDVYAFGATLWALLVHQVPPLSVEIASGIVSLSPVIEMRPDVTPRTSDAISWMMQINRDKRPGTIAEAMQALGVPRTGDLLPVVQTVPPQLPVPVPLGPAPTAAPITRMISPQEEAANHQKWLAPLALIAVMLLGLVAFAAHRMLAKPLRPPMAHVQVLVNSVPPGAHVTLHGQVQKNLTPLPLELIAGDPVSIEVTKDGYKPMAQTFDVAPDTRQLNLKLEPAPVRFNVHISPDNAQVTLDGKPYGAGILGPAFPLEMAPGHHTLSVAAAGYKAVHRGVDVSVGQKDVDLSFPLESQTVGVTVNGSPAGARVFVDGADRGALPVTLRLVPGRHTLHAEKTGFLRSDDQAVELKPGVDTDVDLSLAAVPPVPVAAPRPANDMAIVPSERFGPLKLGASADLLLRNGFFRTVDDGAHAMLEKGPVFSLTDAGGHVVAVAVRRAPGTDGVRCGDIRFGTTAGDVMAALGKPLYPFVLNHGLMMYRGVAFSLYNGRVNEMLVGHFGPEMRILSYATYHHTIDETLGAEPRRKPGERR